MTEGQERSPRANGFDNLRAVLSGRLARGRVVDVDHHATHGGLAIETDYIVEVTANGEAFRISKTYSAFRSLASDLKHSAKSSADNRKVSVPKLKKPELVRKTSREHRPDWSELPKSTRNMINASESLKNLIESESTQYLAKLTYTFVKSIAKQRRAIIDQALDVIFDSYPNDGFSNQGVAEFAKIIETFLLTDVVYEETDEESTKSKKKRKYSLGGKPKNKKEVGANQPDAKKTAEPDSIAIKAGDGIQMARIAPISVKMRESVRVRSREEAMLKDRNGLTIQDEPVKRQAPTANNMGPPAPGMFDSPLSFGFLSVVAVYVLYSTSSSSITVDSDLALLLGFACFCLGFHSPHAQVVELYPHKIRTARVSIEEPVDRRASMHNRNQLLKKSMRSSIRLEPTLKKSLRNSMISMRQLDALSELKELEEEDESEIIGEEEDEQEQLQSPLPTFPKGAQLGSVMNCVSETPPADYNIRGPNYLKDKKKVPSGPFLFPFRGVDLFLTDLCPENVGSNPGVMGGHLGEKPTFIVNFRLPWAVLLFYAEIPAKLLPFLHACYESNYDKSKLPSMDKMTGPERAAARYLMGNDEHKNETLKIVPVVVKGPWVVKSVVGGKPAIIGNKMPVTYYYQPRVGDRAEYLEMDLDIVASSAARGILSVVKSYTSILTLDLGFVVEGKKEDELPEQMMVGSRLHSIDPLTAPPLPPMPQQFMDLLASQSEVED